MLGLFTFTERMLVEWNQAHFNMCRMLYKMWCHTAICLILLLDEKVSSILFEFEMAVHSTDFTLQGEWSTPIWIQLHPLRWWCMLVKSKWWWFSSGRSGWKDSPWWEFAGKQGNSLVDVSMTHAHSQVLVTGSTLPSLARCQKLMHCKERVSTIQIGDVLSCLF